MNLKDTIEEKAMTDGNYAIAYALLQCATALDDTASALDTIGMNNHNPEGPPGCLEQIAILMGAKSRAGL